MVFGLQGRFYLPRNTTSALSVVADDAIQLQPDPGTSKPMSGKCTQKVAEFVIVVGWPVLEPEAADRLVAYI